MVSALLTPRLAVQLAAIIGLSTALGLTFNASNPIGIQFKTASKTEVPPATPVGPAVPTALPQPPAAHTHAPPVAPTPLTPVAQTTVVPPAVPDPGPQPTPPSPTPVPSDPAVPGNPSPITWAEAKPLILSGQAVLVDVRPKPTFDAGHIPGALSLPEASTPEELAAFQNQFSRDLPLIFYCSSTSCPVSKRVAERMVREFNYASVRYMSGGYQEWQQAELTHQPQAPQP